MLALRSTFSSGPRSGPWAVAGGIALALALSACGDDADPAATTGATQDASGGGSPKAGLSVKLSPEQTGTADDPRSVRLAVDVRMEDEDPGGGEAYGQGAAPGGAADPNDDARAGEVDIAPVRTVDIQIPVGVLFRPDELTACSSDTLATEGPTGCPKTSKLGSGTVGARSGTIEVEGQATALYGGGDRVVLWVEISNPVAVGEAIEGRLESQPGGGYRLALEVPAALQEVAGLPIALQRLRVSLGRDGALATTACPDGGLPFSVRLELTDDAVAEATTKAVCS